MGKLKIYGTPVSRTARVLWMANELGLDYEHDKVDFRDGGTKTPEYLAINPNAKIPAIQDGDLVMWESGAINLYLAKKHPGPMTPKTLEEEALTLQWTLWGLLEIEGPLVTMMQHRLFRPEAERDEGAAKAAEATLQKPLAVLDARLAGRDWLLGERFTVADLNLAGVLSASRMVKLDLSGFKNVDAWLTNCTSRPAYAKARGG